MNTLKTFFLLMVLTGMLLAHRRLPVGGQAGLIIALVFALAMNFGAYWFSDKIALSMAHAKEITREDDPQFYDLVEEQARLANMPMPKVYEIDSDPSPNAFATGRNPQNAAVAVTTGIRHILTREELAGVMAHEMAHVGNRDTLIMTIVATIAGAITMLAFMAQFAAIFGSFRRTQRRRRGRRRRQHNHVADHRHHHAHRRDHHPDGHLPGPRVSG